MPDKTPIELPRPPQRVTITLGRKRYALDVRIAELPAAKAEVVEMPAKERE